MSVELSERRALAVQRSAHTVAAVAGLIVLIVGLSDNDPYYSASWPLTVAALIIGAGLAAGALLQRVAGPAVQQTAHTLAAVAALVVLVAGLSDAAVSSKSPLTITAVILGVGLASGPLAQLVSGRAVRRSAPTFAAVAGLIVLMIGLSSNDPYYSPSWPLAVPAVILGAGLAAGALLQRVGRPAVQQAAHTAASIATLAVLVVGLSNANVTYRPPLTITAVILGAGLIVAGLLTRPARGRASDCCARVDRASRTRRGALDVQAERAAADRA